ncbi:alpha/beta hydrolase, partial [Streptomyces sp. DT225]
SLGPSGAQILGDAADPGDDDLWFGRDPASKAFGARRFPVDEGPGILSGGKLNTDAHGQYFDPVRDNSSANSIALVAAGKARDLKA